LYERNGHHAGEKQKVLRYGVCYEEGRGEEKGGLLGASGGKGDPSSR